MANSLSVNITADVADLRAKLALAQADLRAFNSETKSLADQMRAAGESGGASLGAGLQSAAAGAAKARAEVAALNSEIKASSGAAVGGFAALRQDIEGLAPSIGNLRGLFAGAVAALGVGEFAAAIGTVTKLGEELEILSQKTRIPVPALSDLRFAAGQLNIDFQTLQQAMRGLAVTAEEAIINPAGKQAAAYRQLGIDTAFLKANQNDLLTIYRAVTQAYATGGTATQQADNAQILFLRGGRELLPMLQQGSEWLDRMAQKNRELGAEVSGLTAEQLATQARAVRELSAAWEGLETRLTVGVLPSLTKVTNALSLLIAGVHKEGPDDWKKALGEVAIQTAADETRKLQAQIADLKSEQAGLSIFDTRYREIDRAIAAAEHQLLDWKRSADSANATLDAMRTKGAAATANLPLPDSTAAHAAEAASALGGAGAGTVQVKPWKTLDDGSQQASALEKFREGLAELRASWTESNVALLAEEAQRWDAERNLATLNEKEKVEAEKGYFDAVRALRQAERTESEAIARSDADTQIQLARLALAGEKTVLDEGLAQHKVTAAQKEQILADLANREYQLTLDELQRELTALENQPVEWERVYNQIKVLKAQHVNDMAALDRQETADAKREADEQARSYKSMIDEITGFETGLVGDIFTKRQSLTLSLEQMAARLVEKEIENDLKYYTTKALYSALGLAWDEKAATGGALVHLFAEQRKNAATAAGVAQRNAIESTEGTSLFGRIGSWLAQWLGFESTRTAATAAGAAERKAAQLAGLAAEVTAGFSQIQIDASVAAAGAYAATASIPIIGPELAPAAAATAYAATIGWAAGLGGGIAFAAGGMEIYKDQLIFAHRNEMVLPADISLGLKGLITGGTGPGALAAGGGGGNTSISTGDLNATIMLPPRGISEDELVRTLWNAWRNGNAVMRDMMVR